MRHWIIGLLALTLSACWTSERPTIPVELLEQPAGLPGRYWTIAQDEQGGSPGLIEFRRGTDGAMIGDAAGQPGSGTFRLTATSIPGLYLKIIDNNQESVFYGFMEHRDFGAWQEYGIVEIDNDVFAAPNLAWMRSLAARHELTLDVSDPESTRIGGKIHGWAIPALFADPEFLATLEVVQGELLLPSPPAPEERPELFPPGTLSFTLQIEQPDLPEAQWIAPAGLEGHDLVSSPGDLHSRPQGMRFARLPDGRFEIRETLGRDAESKPWIWGILPLKGVNDHYLVVRFETWTLENRERHYLSLAILSRGEGEWSLSELLVRGTGALVGRQDLLSRPMNDAAARQGAALDQFTLRGVLSAAGLLALLQDGQFTTGLKVDRETAQYFVVDEPQADSPVAPE